MFKQINQGSITKIYYFSLCNTIVQIVTLLLVLFTGIFWIKTNSLIALLIIFGFAAIILGMLLYRVWRYDAKPITINLQSKIIKQGDTVVAFRDIKTFYIKASMTHGNNGSHLNQRIAIRTQQDTDIYLTGWVYWVASDKQRLKVIAALCSALKLENPYDDKGRLKDPVHIAPKNNVYSKEYQDKQTSRLKKYGYARVIGDYIRNVQVDGEDDVSVFQGKLVIAGIIFVVATSVLLLIFMIITLL